MPQINTPLSTITQKIAQKWNAICICNKTSHCTLLTQTHNQMLPISFLHHPFVFLFFVCLSRLYTSLNVSYALLFSAIFPLCMQWVGVHWINRAENLRFFNYSTEQCVCASLDDFLFRKNWLCCYASLFHLKWAQCTIYFSFFFYFTYSYSLWVFVCKQNFIMCFFRRPNTLQWLFFKYFDVVIIFFLKHTPHIYIMFAFRFHCTRRMLAFLCKRKRNLLRRICTVSRTQNVFVIEGFLI